MNQNYHVHLLVIDRIEIMIESGFFDVVKLVPVAKEMKLTELPQSVLQLGQIHSEKKVRGNNLNK